MKIIITETQSLFLKRRLEQIDEFVKLALGRVPSGGYHFHDYVEEIVWQVLDEFDQKGGVSKDGMEEIADFVRENYWRDMERQYLRNVD